MAIEPVFERVFIVGAPPALKLFPCVSVGDPDFRPPPKKTMYERIQACQMTAEDKAYMNQQWNLRWSGWTGKCGATR